MTDHSLYHRQHWYQSGKGPRYLQLYRMLCRLIRSGRLEAGSQIPPERLLAEYAEVSRVTVRRAVQLLAEERLIEQRRGAGTFVREASPRLEQSLSSLLSFTENLRQRGQQAETVVLECGLYPPDHEEILTLGLSTSSRVARIKRLRLADQVPMAIEHSSLPEDILPQPELVTSSLYQVLRQAGNPLMRAIQRVSATNVSDEDAQQLQIRSGDAVLSINRTGYLAFGRPIEYTRGIYRPDIYDFVSELRLEQTEELPIET